MNLVSVSELPSTTKAVATEKPVNLLKVCKNMEQVCRRFDGLGLSAVQVGLDWKLFILKSGEGYRHFVDCAYSPVGDDKIQSFEGCLSLPGKFFVVARWRNIHVQGYELVIENHTPKLIFFSSEYSDKLMEVGSVVFQHEIDHQNDVLISRHGLHVNPVPISG